MAYFATTDIESSHFFGSSTSTSSPWSEIISKYLNGTSEKQLDDHRDLIDYGFPVFSGRENEESGCSSEARRRRHYHHRHHRHHKHQHRLLLLLNC
jgi:hypothetical protein